MIITVDELDERVLGSVCGGRCVEKMRIPHLTREINLPF